MKESESIFDGVWPASEEQRYQAYKERLKRDLSADFVCDFARLVDTPRSFLCPEGDSNET